MVVAGFALAAAFALALGWYVGQSGVGSAPANAESLFAVSLPDREGHQQSFEQWRGKVVVVNFWATWCGPCREEMPEFVKAQKDLGGRGLQFVGVAVDEPAKVAQFADEIGVNYPLLIGGFGAMELSKTYGNKVAALPFTVVIDRQGRIAHTQLGVLAPAKLHSLAERLL
ncbi:MAG: TlpA disulfide reductase family protein [Casimicrobiaceae bacterium]